MFATCNYCVKLPRLQVFQRWIYLKHLEKDNSKQKFKDLNPNHSKLIFKKISLSYNNPMLSTKEQLGIYR